MKSLIVEALGKRYWIRKAQVKAGAGSRLDRLKSFFAIPLARDLAGARELWALRDVSFDVEPGTVLGIIGANGAGKSTLLKLIAKVIAPTSGTIRGRGRVVSLLELGAGFDDESTARENIYMNAALNGIPRHVVEQRFDEIIDFAELGEFVDQDLKFFSSGMYLRLAFSVAINMEPGILLADEILAVGDMAFQERCLQKVRELAGASGLTVLFVSHDMEAIARICDRVIWVNGGELRQDGDPDEVVTAYQNAAWDLMANPNTEDKGRSRAGHFGEILDVRLISSDGREIGSPPRSEDVYVRIRFRTLRTRVQARCAFDLLTKGVLVFRSVQPVPEPIDEEGVYEAMARIPANFLAETGYTVNVAVTLLRRDADEHALVANKALSFLVYGDQQVEPAARHRTGVIDPVLDWSLHLEPHAARV
jgi:lipopolysaccharide transport system ATP-binding protein